MTFGAEVNYLTENNLQQTQKLGPTEEPPERIPTMPSDKLDKTVGYTCLRFFHFNCMNQRTVTANVANLTSAMNSIYRCLVTLDTSMANDSKSETTV